MFKNFYKRGCKLDSETLLNAFYSKNINIINYLFENDYINFIKIFKYEIFEGDLDSDDLYYDEFKRKVEMLNNFLQIQKNYHVKYFKKKIAAKKIQRFYTHRLYNPDNVKFIKKIEKKFKKNLKKIS